MRKLLLIPIFLFAGCIACGFNSHLCHAQEYSAKDGKLEIKKIIPQQEDNSYLTVDDIKKNIKSAQAAIDAATEDQNRWIDLLNQATDAGLIDKKEASEFIAHGITDEVQGVNWSNTDLIKGN